MKYRVSNFGDISKKVVPFFKRYSLFGKKRVSFELFSQIVELMKQQAHLDESGLQKIISLVNELKTLNKKGL